MFLQYNIEKLHEAITIKLYILLKLTFLACGNKNILKREKARHSRNSLTARYTRKGWIGKTESKIRAKLSERLSLTYQQKNKGAVTVDDYLSINLHPRSPVGLSPGSGTTDHNHVIIFAASVSFPLLSEYCERAEEWG